MEKHFQTKKSDKYKSQKLHLLGSVNKQSILKNDNSHITRTDKNLNSRTAKDSQGLVRTCQVLDHSLQVPLLALQVLYQSLPVLGNPGDTLTRTGTQKNPKPIQGL